MEHIGSAVAKEFLRGNKISIRRRGKRSMSENKIEISPDFQELVQEAENAGTLEELFEVWKRAHILEVEEWKANKKEGEEQKPSTVPVAFLNTDIVPSNELEETMKNSFCGDGYIGRSGGKDKKYSNWNNGESEEKRKFKKFFILKEEDHIQKVVDWERGIQPYNTYFGDWAYDNRKMLVDDDGRPTTSMAAKTAEIARFIANERKKNFDWKSKSESAERDRIVALENTAIININKRGGSTEAKANALVNYAKKYDRFILKEIELLAPAGETDLEFIVFGKPQNYFEVVKDILTDKKNGYPRSKICNLAHPSRVSYKSVETDCK